MKNTRICPKCQSHNVNKASGTEYPGISMGLYGYAPVAKYFCGDCGYVEEWVENHLYIENLNEFYNALKIKQI